MNTIIFEWENHEQAIHKEEWNQWVVQNEQEQKWVNHLNLQFHRLDFALQKSVETLIKDGKVNSLSDAFQYYENTFNEKALLIDQRKPRFTTTQHPIFEPKTFVATRQQVLSHLDEIVLKNWNYEASTDTCFAIFQEITTKKTFECHVLLLTDLLTIFEKRAMEPVKEGGSLSEVYCRLQMMQLVKLIGEPAVSIVKMSQ